jgi:hypothetical protein
MSPRRALLALAVCAAPLLQVVGMAGHPELPESDSDVLALVAQDPSDWFLVHLLAASAAALFAVPRSRSPPSCAAAERAWRPPGRPCSCSARVR